MKQMRSGVVACVVMLLFNGSALASTVFSNLGSGDTYNVSVYNVVRGATADPPFGSADQAYAFTVGSTAYTLTSVEAALSFCGGPNIFLLGCNAPNQINLLLMADADGAPGSSLQSLLVNVPNIGYPASGALLSVPAVAPLTLEANSTYWIVGMSPHSESYFPWLVNNTGHSNTLVRHDSGPWETPGPGVFPAGAFRINGDPVSAVPEPASLSLLGVGLFTLMAGRTVWRGRVRTKGRGNA